MTSDEFIAKIQRTYGDEHTLYRGEMKGQVKAWAKNRSDRALALVYAELLKLFSTRWGKLPFVAELEEAWQSVLENRSQELKEPVEVAGYLEGESEDVVDPETSADFLHDILVGLKSGKRPAEVLAEYEEVTDDTGA